MKILFFAQLKDVAGQTETDLPCEQPLTGDELWDKLIAAYPGLEKYRRHVRLTRNCEYATPEDRFADTDEVALIPPVSGG